MTREHRTDHVPSHPAWPPGDGEMARRIRAHDWAATPLGPIEQWPLPLRTALSMVLDHPLPMVLVWGPDLITLHNDAYRPLLGGKPDALGRPFLEVWDAARDAIAPRIERTLAGETIRLEDASFTLLRQGRPEEAFFSYAFSPVRDETGAVVGVLNTAFEATEQAFATRRHVAAQDALRESEERQAFLLKLSDALRPIGDPVEIQRTATRLLGEHLKASRVFYVVVEGDGDTAAILGDYTDGVPSRVGRYSLSAFSSSAVGEWRTGKIASCDDVNIDPRYSEADREAYASVSTRAGFGVPLIKEERLVALLGVNQSSPRHWTGYDTDLASEIAERTWAAVERARAEATLRESEARFGQFVASSSDALWIRDAATLAMEYVSPAIETIYGVQTEAVLGDPKRWAAIIVPEDREAALEQLERAREGDAVTHEFRILRASDGAFRWIRNTDFPLLDAQGRVQRIGGIAEDVTEAKQATEHQTVLLLELQHRVRNILAMIRSVADRTGDTAGDVDDYRDRLQGRLRALARVQTLLTRAANVGVDLATLIRAEVEAQAAHEGQFTLTGAGLLLSPKAAEVLTLAAHELAANALKYGAFSHAAGRLSVAWRVRYEADEPWLRLDWTEAGLLSPLQRPERQGFGTSLIEQRIPYELNGYGTLAFEPDGVRCRLEFPLRRGDSILETDAVTLSTTVAGGALDMAGEADLSGRKVLVVEDDFYLAADLARALSKAGGTVLGPVGQEDKALALIASEAPSCAVVDINLGQGVQFAVAEALQGRGVPFVFVTGYDDVVIPPRFEGVERLRKPVELRHVVRVAAQLFEA